jgi:hypothetical protein
MDVSSVVRGDAQYEDSVVAILPVSWSVHGHALRVTCMRAQTEVPRP